VKKKKKMTAFRRKNRRKIKEISAYKAELRRGLGQRLKQVKASAPIERKKKAKVAGYKIGRKRQKQSYTREHPNEKRAKTSYNVCLYDEEGN